MLFCKTCTFLDARKQKCELFNSVLPKISIRGKIQFMKDKECLHKNDFCDNDLFELIFSGKKTFVQVEGWKE